MRLLMIALAGMSLVSLAAHADSAAQAGSGGSTRLAADSCRNPDYVRMRIQGGSINRMRMTINRSKTSGRPVHYVDAATQELVWGEEFDVCRDTTLIYSWIF